MESKFRFEPSEPCGIMVSTSCQLKPRDHTRLGVWVHGIASLFFVQDEEFPSLYRTIPFPSSHGPQTRRPSRTGRPRRARAAGLVAKDHLPARRANLLEFLAWHWTQYELVLKWGSAA
jgi:hypothetical protein